MSICTGGPFPSSDCNFLLGWGTDCMAPSKLHLFMKMLSLICVNSLLYFRQMYPHFNHQYLNVTIIIDLICCKGSKIVLRETSYRSAVKNSFQKTASLQLKQPYLMKHLHHMTAADVFSCVSAQMTGKLQTQT